MKNILILNGSPREKGNTKVLIDSFIKGAESSKNNIKLFNIEKMNIHGCIGCYNGGKDSKSPCTQKDDMDDIYPEFEKADIIVLASPMYYWTITAQLKTVLDRTLAIAEKYNYELPKKDSILLMAAGGSKIDNFEPIIDYYTVLVKRLNWNDLGQIYAKGVNFIGDIMNKPVLKEAEILGKSIK